MTPAFNQFCFAKKKLHINIQQTNAPEPEDVRQTQSGELSLIFKMYQPASLPERPPALGRKASWRERIHSAERDTIAWSETGGKTGQEVFFNNMIFYCPYHNILKVFE